MKKRILAILLSLCMAAGTFSDLGVTAAAMEKEQSREGDTEVSQKESAAEEKTETGGSSKVMDGDGIQDTETAASESEEGSFTGEVEVESGSNTQDKETPKPESEYIPEKDTDMAEPEDTNKDDNTAVTVETETMQQNEASASDFVIENGVLKGYKGKGGDVRIPEGVTGISNDAFYGNDDLTSIYIPDSVKTIERESFRFCGNLRSVRLPLGLTEIGVGTFEGCSRLSDITLPQGLKKIGGYAFDYCNELRNVKIPDGVTVLGEELFTGADNLETIIIPKSVETIGNNLISQNSDAVLIVENNSEALGYAQKFGLNYAQAQTDARLTFTIKGAGQLMVTKNGIPVASGTVLKVGDSINVSTQYSGCGETVKANGYDLTMLKIKKNGWSGENTWTPQETLKNREFVIKKDTNIEAVFLGSATGEQVLNKPGQNLKYTFGGSDVMKPAGVAGQFAMQYKAAKKGKVTVTTKVQGPGYLQFNIFSNRYEYDYTFKIDNVAKDEDVKGGGWALYAYSLGAGMHTVEWSFSSQRAEYSNFSGLAALGSVALITNPQEIPVTGISLNKNRLDLKIGEKASLKYTISPAEAKREKVNWSSSDESVAVVQNGTVIGMGQGKAYITAEIDGFKSQCEVFVTNRSIQGDFEMDGSVVTAYFGNSSKVVLPKGTTEIGDKAFQGNTGITEIGIPESVLKIGAYAFDGCSSLKSLVIPDSVQEIGRNAFAYCSALESLVLGRGVTALGHFVFFKAKSLQTAAIPATVKEIDNDAFSKVQGMILYCEKDSAAYEYALKRGFKYCLVADEILGDEFDSAPYTAIQGEETVQTEFQDKMFREIIVEYDTEYTYFCQGRYLYRFDIARNVFDYTYVLDIGASPVNISVRDSIIYFELYNGDSAQIKGYDIRKSKIVYEQTFPEDPYFGSFTVDGNQNFYFSNNSIDLNIYDAYGNLKDSKILSSSSFLTGMRRITLNSVSNNNQVVFASYYSTGRGVSYTEDYAFSDLGLSIGYLNNYYLYEGYQLVRNGSFIDTKYWIKNPSRNKPSEWRFFEHEKYAVNQFGEIAEFNWASPKADGFDYNILYRANHQEDAPENASAYMNAQIYVGLSKNQVLKYNTKQQSVDGVYNLGADNQVLELYTSNEQIYVRYKKGDTNYIAPLETFQYQKKHKILRDQHTTLTYSAAQVKNAYRNSLAGQTYGTENSHYKTKPQAKAPYKAGELSQNVVTDTLKRLNYARWQSGLNAVSIKKEYMERSQKGAVLLNATGILSHSPTKPRDMNDSFYEEGKKGVGAGIDYSGNISQGDSMTDSIFGYLDDVNNLVSKDIGHRLSLLDKKASATSFGFSGYYSALSMYYGEGELGNNQEFYAWPSAGYFPSEGIAKNAMWHIITSCSSIRNLKVILESGGKRYQPQISYDSFYGAYYFSPPEALVQSLTDGKRQFATGKTVKVTLEGMYDEMGNDIVVTYPITFLACDILSEYKAQAEKKLDNYKNPNLYRNAQKAELSSIIKAWKKQIDYADSKQDIESLVKRAKKQLDQVKTSAQMKAGEVSSVKLNKNRVTLNKGGSVILIPTVKPSTALDKSVTWKSSNKSVASVSRGGKVTALQEGSTRITVKTRDKGKTAECKITVKFTGKWVRTSRGYRYQLKDGTYLKKSWKTEGKKKYYLSSSGYRTVGLKKIGSKKYYFDKNGVMQTGIRTISKKKYYFDKNGVMGKGMIAIGKKTYYFDSSGVMKTKWVKIKNKWYYFDKKGVLQKNKHIGKYYVNKNGVRVKP